MFFQAMYSVKEAKSVRPKEFDEVLASIFLGDYSLDLLIQWMPAEKRFEYLLDYSHQGTSVKSERTNLLTTQRNLSELSQKMRALLVEFINDNIGYDEVNSIDKEIIARQRDIGLIAMDLTNALVVYKNHGRKILKECLVTSFQPLGAKVPERCIELDGQSYPVRNFGRNR